MENLKQLLSIGVVLLCSLSAAYGQITPSDDAYTSSAASSTNYGTAITLSVSATATGTTTAFIRFDLSSIPSTYTGANIAQATLKLYVAAVPAAGSFNVDYVTGSWSEKTIKETEAPGIGATIVSNVNLVTTNKGEYILINVTPALVAWLDGTETNYGLVLVANSPLSATFDSKENSGASHPPELDVVYAGGGIAGVTTASGSGLTGGGTSGTLNLALTNACATNQVLQWNGSGWACSAAGTGTVTSVGISAPASDFTVSGSPVTGGGTLNLAWNVAPSSNSVANSIVKRDGSGSFYAGTISAVQFTGSSVSVQSVLAQNAFSQGTAIEGVSTSATDGSAGMMGFNTATSAKTYGVLGSVTSRTGHGVLGTAVASSTLATSFTGAAGVWGDTSSNGGVSTQGVTGLLGTADDGAAITGANNSSGATLSLANFTASSGSKLIQALAPNLPNQEPFLVDASGNLSIGGKVTVYNGKATSGNGVAPITVSLTQTSKSSVQFTDVLAGVQGLFRVSVYAVCAGPTGSSGDGFSVQVLWTDATNTAQNLYAKDTSGSDYVACGTAAADFAQATFVVQNIGGSGKDIILVVGNSGSATGTYDLFLTIEQLM
jgi:hypothetical protein